MFSCYKFTRIIIRYAAREEGPAMLKERRIVLGVTGGIAAYKAAELVRELVRRGAQVRVIMTDHAANSSPP